MTSISSIVVAIDFQQVRGTIKNVDVYNNKLLNTLADSVITKTLRWVTMVMEIRLSNNTIDNRATIVAGLSQQFLQQKLNQNLSIIQSPETSSFRVTKE